MNNKDKKDNKKFNFVSAEDLDKTTTSNHEVIKNNSSQGGKKVVSKNNNKKGKKKKGKTGASPKKNIEKIEKKSEKTSLVKQNDKTPQKGNAKKSNAKKSNSKVSAPKKSMKNKSSKSSVSEDKIEEKNLKSVVTKKSENKSSKSPISEERIEEKDLRLAVSEKDIKEEISEPSVSIDKVEEKDLELAVPEKDMGGEHPKFSVSEDKVDEKNLETTAKEKEIPGRLFDEVSETEKKKNSKLRIYFSFEERVITLVFSIILLFVISCILILKAIDFGEKEKITYDEVSNVGYKVCLKDNDYYHNDCLDEGMEYVSSLTDKIEVDFDYNVDFSTEIDYDLSYHVVGVTRIHNKNDNSKILYQNEDLLVEKTDISKLDDSIRLEKNIAVDYVTFQEKVLNYMSKYSEDASATLEVILYLDEPTETRKVSSVTIPLGSQTYAVTKSELSNKNKSVEIINGPYDTYNSVYISVGIILLLVDLLILFKTTKFVFNATAKRDKFRAKLGQILRDYDRMIVVARDGFISTGDKKIVKVANFNELLDASTMLQKPIIYSRINNVKSEFIVEDSDTLYKYVMKEADFSK